MDRREGTVLMGALLTPRFAPTALSFFFLYNLFNIPGSPNRGSRIQVNNLRPIRVNKLVVEYM